MFEEFAALQPVKEAAEILAQKADWPKLYDLETLESNSVPVAGATYYEDMYVDFELAQVNPQTFIGCTYVLYELVVDCAGKAFGSQRTSQMGSLHNWTPSLHLHWQLQLCTA